MRYEVTIPDGDPRFDDLVAFFGRIVVPGRKSPVPRIIAEYALLGFLLTTGKIAVGGGDGITALPTLPEDIPDPAKVAAAQRAVQGVIDDLFS